MNLYINNFKALFLVLFLAFSVSSCKDKNDDFVPLFSIEDDKALGAQLKAEIEANPQDYPVLPVAGNQQAYSYLRGMVTDILNSGAVTYKEEFLWETYIIEDDSVLNAFAAPGGYIYVYTGLIKYLDKADDLAGVLGHEIAHADKRHSVKQLQRQYGIQILLSIALGNEPSQLGEILGGLAGTSAVLKFSRDAETEADMFSVDYLAGTDYACNGAAYFFQKLNAAGSASPPTFLSTHPDPADRITSINNKATEKGCDTTPINETGLTYDQFQNALP